MTICDNCIHNDVCGLEGCMEEALTFCVHKVSNVTRQSVKRGKWEHLVSRKSGFHYEVGARCSCCNEYTITVCLCEAMPFEFCPHCTADMRGE